jgi:hypothetical protein
MKEATDNLITLRGCKSPGVLGGSHTRLRGRGWGTQFRCLDGQTMVLYRVIPLRSKSSFCFPLANIYHATNQVCSGLICLAELLC